MRPYSNKLSELMQGFSSASGSSSKSFTENRQLNKVLVVAISSNRGLCGAFNANIAKEISILKSKNKFKNSKIDFLTIGKKINDTLSKTETVIQNSSDVFDDLNYENVSNIANELINHFTSLKYDHIEIVYNSFKNAATQIIKSEQFLPIPVNEDTGSENLDYIFEPSLESIANTLIPKSLKIQLFKAIRDSFASEHGARMTAMHKATDNASELRDELKLTYNKARQASITNEILEIVGGAEALNN
jgi:F-type H+-transporting ATPase subunit gamma